MKQFLPLVPRVTTSLLLASLLLGSTACHREADEVSATGTIASTILPAGYATRVTATDAAGHSYAATPDPTTGTFKLVNVPAGSYTLIVDTKLAYKMPAPQQAQVKAGLTTALYYSTLTRDAKLRGTLSWVENGVRYTAVNLYGEVNNGLVSVDGYVLSNGVGREVAFVIPTYGQASSLFTGVGTYTLGQQEYPFGKYTLSNSAGPSIWYTPRQGTGTGQVQITQYDPAAFAIAGTFTFTAEPFSNPTGTPGNVTITEGSFSLTY
ncbi:hypothetical protein GO988_23445 [Hymenobacter sp. HMF4947]|uniref:Carboxypeptidase regulatory-like domain-containing protein n=1 Tax=Hymenobacter ginkgonis TaxID=2682976 RepID=A0A7K1TLK0_9BACT|nr:DUF6252 family protein [Hymenobacter ginkgonis]MVN79298.1 hypothetical protein [Hymenobacter ginkgonis]